MDRSVNTFSDLKIKVVIMEAWAIVDYVEKQLKRLLPQKKEKPPVSTRVCISLSPNEVLATQIEYTTEGTDIRLFKNLTYDDTHEIPLLLSGLITKYHLNESPVSWLLPLEDYQLFLIESPPVPEKELASALHWRVRSLLSYPIEDAAIDYFVFPAKKSATSNSMVGVVAARLSEISKTMGILNSSGLEISVIDIPELAMRNLTALYEDDEKSTAFIYFFEKTIVFNISRQKILYFSRRIHRREDIHENTSELESFCLEIMRYFDYYQTKWRHPSPTRIFVASVSDDTDQLTKKISEYLYLTVEPYTLKTMNINPLEKEQIEKKFLLQIGATLRKDHDYVSPAN